MKVLAVVNIGDEFQPAKTFPNVGSLVSTILPNLYILAGILLFVLLIIGGLGFIMGAGGGDPKKTGQGGKAVTAAIGGFFLVFLSYWIIILIEKITGLNILHNP